LATSGHEVAAVITRPDAPRGRGRIMTPSPVAVAAEQLGFDVLKPAKPSDPEFVAALADLAPDCVAVVAYGALLPATVLQMVPHGWVNLHFSLLPTWRGASPVQHAILAGDEVTGATTFLIVPELDAGPVFGHMTYEVPPRATSGEVLDALATSADHLLLATLDAIAEGAATPVPQDSALATWAPKITVEDAHLIWTHPAQALDRRIRAMDPAPGAWTTFRGQRLRLGRPLPGDGGAPALAPGQVSAAGGDVWVGTGTCPLRLGTLQPAGKPHAMEAASWARGARLTPDDHFGGDIT
jgi:methionyl-tRNA formyltransferase